MNLFDNHVSTKFCRTSVGDDAHIVPYNALDFQNSSGYNARFVHKISNSGLSDGTMKGIVPYKRSDKILFTL